MGEDVDDWKREKEWNTYLGERNVECTEEIRLGLGSALGS
jgi:hypothetical protein